MTPALGNTSSTETPMPENVHAQCSRNWIEPLNHMVEILHTKMKIFLILPYNFPGLGSCTGKQQLTSERQCDFDVLHNNAIGMLTLGPPGAMRRNLRQGFCTSTRSSHLALESLWMALLLLQKESDSVDNDTTLYLAVPLKAQKESVTSKSNRENLLTINHGKKSAHPQKEREMP